MIPAQKFAYDVSVVLGVSTALGFVFAVICVMIGRKRGDAHLVKLSNHLIWLSLFGFALATIVTHNIG